MGDLPVVLVGRVGEAAPVTEEYHAWNIARTVAVIRTSGPDEAAWLRLWLSSSHVHDWCVPPPTAGARTTLLRTVRAVEEKTAVNRCIAECAMSLTDALFAVEVKDGAARPERSFGSVAHLRVGHQSRPGWTTPLSSDPSAERGTALVAPADVPGRKSTVANKYEPRTTAWCLHMSEIGRTKTCECDAAGRALANLAIVS